jgi:hypothetical protein
MEHLKGLKNKFRPYFPDLVPHMEWFRNPFVFCVTKLSSSDEDSAINLKSDDTLKHDFREIYLIYFWFNVRMELKTLENKPIKYLTPFARIYFCGAGFY